jgi:hypothetical protein
MKAHNTDPSTGGSASNVDLILTLGLFVLNPSGKIINGTEQVVLFIFNLERMPARNCVLTFLSIASRLSMVSTLCLHNPK